MLIIILILILGIIVLLFNFFLLRKKLNIERANGFDEYITKEYKKLDEVLRTINTEKERAEQQLQDTLAHNEKILSAQKKLQEQTIVLFKEKEQEKADQAIKDWTRSAQMAANDYSNLIIEAQNEKIQSSKDELEEITAELNEFRAKRVAINEAIRKERELQETENSHRIQLDDFDKEDIYFLNSISNKIHNKEILGKLIWTNYLQKPFNEMINRICGSNIPKNVIYCIENIETHEKYIGKTSASIKDRWTNHIKTTLGIGQLSKQRIHIAMKDNWDKFSFNIIEEVPPNENLSEREKFYIGIFESNVYGYNMRI